MKIIALITDAVEVERRIIELRPHTYPPYTTPPAYAGDEQQTSGAVYLSCGRDSRPGEHLETELRGKDPHSIVEGHE